jgi:hypothetical protein
MGAEAERVGSRDNQRPRISIWPTTNLGQWAVWLAAFFPLVFASSVIPRGAAIGFVCGFAGGIAALTAILRDRERALAVFVAVVPLAIAVAFVIAELIGGL